MRVLICGIDGYIGWPLSLHLTERGHDVRGIDCGLRVELVSGEGSNSLVPIGNVLERRRAYRKKYDKPLIIHRVDISQQYIIENLKWHFQLWKPECIVHLAEQPSAPYSMKDSACAALTQMNNVKGTLNLLWIMKEACPEAHLLKLGSMGEYGTPPFPISEGGWEVTTKKGIKATVPFPKDAGSFYHLSKVHDTHNIMFACKVWGLRSTDIMQGVVYGSRTDESSTSEFRTRLDYDECFGTVINRFCAQAVIGMPLTVYGAGSQIRGFIPLRDSIQCLRLAVENPPEQGEYRVINQFEDIYSVNELADMVKKVGDELGLNVKINNCLDNPRVEKEKHVYEPEHKKLLEMGYKPTSNIGVEIRSILMDMIVHKDRINKDVIMPKVKWK